MATATSFAYKGRDSAGKIVKGKVDAASETAVPDTSEMQASWAEDESASDTARH